MSATRSTPWRSGFTASAATWRATSPACEGWPKKVASSSSKSAGSASAASITSAIRTWPGGLAERSAMQVRKTKLDGVLLIKPEVFEDFRGQYVETYNEEAYKKAGVTVNFVQDDISVSSRHVLRGIHGDAETWKLVSCLYGKFYLVVVNCDKKSSAF